MDTPIAAPVGAPETKVGLVDVKHTSEPATATSEESGKGYSDQQAVQRAGDNPRAAVSTAVPLEKPSVSPLQPIEAIPQTFSQSSWARQNARIQATRGWLPAPILSRFNGLYVFLFVLYVYSLSTLWLESRLTLLKVAFCDASYFPPFST